MSRGETNPGDPPEITRGTTGATGAVMHEDWKLGVVATIARVVAVAAMVVALVASTSEAGPDLVGPLDEGVANFERHILSPF